MMRSRFASLTWAFCLSAAGAVSAQQFALANGAFKYEGCADVVASNFSSTSLVSLSKVPDLTEPVRFQVAKDGRVFFAERNGVVRVVQADGSIVKLGTLPVVPLSRVISGANELGLTGLALAPDFETSNWIYLNYQPDAPDVSRFSRFKVNGTVLDPNSEQILIELPMQKNFCCHTGGGMQFDNKGDLWISVGNNTRNPATAEENSNPLTYVDESSPDKDDQAHAANTNDYRGKILRIHPTETKGADGKYYTIPAGNFRETFASLWTPADLPKVLPEIYSMGHRSNFTMSVDTLKGWLVWGDIGPDEIRATEEFNLTAKPGFFGWPYFAGAKRTGTDTYTFRMNKDENAPMNLSPNNTGVQKLPPAIPATFGYSKNAAITGPIYRWSPHHAYAKKLPPHFDGKWFMTDFNIGQLQAATLDGEGNITARTGLLTGLIRPLQISVGPDGALYTLEYGQEYFATDGRTAIRRWDYNGPACAGPIVGLQDGRRAGSRMSGGLLNLGTDAMRFVTLPQGARGLRLFDLQGKLAWELPAGSPDRSAAVPATVGNGVYRAQYLY